MMDLSEAQKLWYNLQPIEDVLFKYNDDVQIKSGEHAGKFASIISLESLQPIKYLVELDSGDGDIIIAKSKIEKS